MISFQRCIMYIEILYWYDFDYFRFYEAETNPRIKHTKKGLISMVNYGNGMLGSQFFFTLGKQKIKFYRCLLVLLPYIQYTNC